MEKQKILRDSHEIIDDYVKEDLERFVSVDKMKELERDEFPDEKTMIEEEFPNFDYIRGGKDVEENVL